MKSYKTKRIFPVLVTALALLPFSFAAAQSASPADSTSKKAPDNWFNLDHAADGVLGVGTERAYREILKDKPSQTVVVAVIDSGIDIEHEDLQGKIWTNPGEIPGNGIDDDGNGYVDDVHGWNFIGGKDGRNVDQDTYELTRLLIGYKERFGDTDPEKLSKKELKEYKTYLSLKETYENKHTEAQKGYMSYAEFKDALERAINLLKVYMETDEITLEALENFNSPDEKLDAARQITMFALGNGLTLEALGEAVDYFRDQVEYSYNLSYDPRYIVGDNYDDYRERHYGNNDVTGPDAKHGTHVAGIIGADRNNSLGVAGIADNVKIMVLRAVPNGDERDKDIANAIYYAVDNGARIINMSFGKSYSPGKEAVDKAVKYAADKGVLLIHAAGNSAEDLDAEPNFPNRRYGPKGKKQAPNWLEIGASSWEDGEKVAGNFSNYGKKSVDLFAPGVDIYSTVPGSDYKNENGTSMAAPVVSGVAAMLMSYYPGLTHLEVKDIIMKSVSPLKRQVILPGSQDPDGSGALLVPFTDLSSTGGVVNAYQAVKMAENMKTKIGRNR